MTIWSGEIKELEKLYAGFKDHLPYIVRELEQLIKTQDANVVMLYSRRCLEVIITDLCECELNRPRKTEPLKGIIDKLLHEEKVPSHIISSMHSLNSLATFGTHPKDFDPEQVKPVLNNLAVIIRWYLQYKDFKIVSKNVTEEEKHESIVNGTAAKKTFKLKKKHLLLLTALMLVVFVAFIVYSNIIKENKKQTTTDIKDVPVTFTINSEFGDFNDSIKQRLIQDGYVYIQDNPAYKIQIISDPPGDPIAKNGNAEGFNYFYNSTNIRISINDQTPFGIGVTVSKTDPRPNYQEARDEYRKNYWESLNNNFEEIYNQIKKHAPEI